MSLEFSVITPLPPWERPAMGHGNRRDRRRLLARRARVPPSKPRKPGAEVTLFEVASGSGGTSALSGGEIYLGGGGGTPAQQQAGFVDDTEDLYRYLLMAGGPDADEPKVRVYADGSRAHRDWLVEQGLTYKNTYLPERMLEPETDDCLIWSGSEEAWPFSREAKPCPRGHTPQWTGWGGGRMLMDLLAARVVRLGVDVRYDSRVLALIADEADNARRCRRASTARRSLRAHAEASCFVPAGS
ncbi:FAD-dependent oxidoreductase [Cupriavidus basilensis]